MCSWHVNGTGEEVKRDQSEVLKSPSTILPKAPVLEANYNEKNLKGTIWPTVTIYIRIIVDKRHQEITKCVS